MSHHAFAFPYTDPLPLLDSEFDRIGTVDTSSSASSFTDDLAWEDQLDEGDELSI